MPQPPSDTPTRGQIHWHPVLLGLYPALHLLAQNVASIHLEAALPSLAMVALGLGGLWLFFGLLLKDRNKGALLTSATAVLFFSHGHLLGLLDGEDTAAWVLLGVGALALVGVGALVARWGERLEPLNRMLDLMALMLTLMALAPIVFSGLRPMTMKLSRDLNGPIETPLGYLPNIYLIVLDGFGRADLLEEIYDVDLSDLQAHLQAKDFQIAERANANYCQTSLALASLFNSDYIPNLLPPPEQHAPRRSDLNRAVHVNRHVSRLRDIGYQLVTISGGSELGVQDDPDINYRSGALNEYQTTLLASTPLPTIAELLPNRQTKGLNPYAQHRAGVKYQLEMLPLAATEDGPKLVYAHIISPHPPFVIGPNGEDIVPDYKFSIRERSARNGYVKGYAGQVTWLAKELQETVDGILASSERPPVILILGDHGPASRWLDLWYRTKSFETEDPAVLAERMGIFLALHMPAGQGGEVYPELTPVNIFPLIYERCLGEAANLREDHSYFSTYDQWSDFQRVDQVLHQYGRD